MPGSIIKKINSVAERDKATMGLIFMNRHRDNFGWKNEDYNPFSNNNAEYSNAVYPYFPAEFPGPGLERDNQSDTISREL